MKKIQLFLMLLFLSLFGLINCNNILAANKLHNKKGSGSLYPSKPNIVLIFVDDLGWADLGYRNPIFQTPNIDCLKNDGMDFSRAYIATPTCSPSRASLLTGKEPVRFQMVRHIPDDKENGFDSNGRTSKPYNLLESDPAQLPSRNWLPLEETTYAEELKELGYYNAFIGKWHLGSEEYYPIKQGFDEQYGVSNFGHPNSYYQPYFKHENPLESIDNKAYLTDVLTDKTENFIKSYNKDKPFMLTLWYYNVHSPFVGRTDFVEKYKAKGLNGDFAQYAAQISAVDESIGRIRKALKDKGIDDNTVILFLSDQGGYFTNAPLSGGKLGGNTLGEGGARVPFIVYYPKVIKANSSCDIPVQSIDIYPTLIEIASGKKYKNDKVNGISLFPLFVEKKINKRNLYFFRSYEDQYAAIIYENWKLIAYHSGKFELYDISKDISEKSNLLYAEPKIAQKLKKDLTKWEEKVLGNAQK